MRAPFDRDQEATPFAAALETLCRATGATCAALVDQEGETVDYGGHGEPFEIRILAAELRLLLQYVQGSRQLGVTGQLVIRARRKSFLLCSLPEGYALVVQLGRRASGISERPLLLAVRELCQEAGFDFPGGGSVFPPQGNWRSVRVAEDKRRSHRPCQVDTPQGPAEVEVIGRLASAPQSKREFGYRVRLSSGEEGTLVREPLGHWYLEEDP